MSFKIDCYHDVCSPFETTARSLRREGEPYSASTMLYTVEVPAPESHSIYDLELESNGHRRGGWYRTARLEEPRH
jgi:hypothetical protein